MKKIELTLLAAQIEFNWWFIKRARQKGNKLIELGYSLSSPKLLSLNRRLSRHSSSALKAQMAYESLDGTSITLHSMSSNLENIAS